MHVKPPKWSKEGRGGLVCQFIQLKGVGGVLEWSHKFIAFYFESVHSQSQEVFLLLIFVCVFFFFFLNFFKKRRFLFFLKKKKKKKKEKERRSAIVFQACLEFKSFWLMTDVKTLLCKQKSGSDSCSIGAFITLRNLWTHFPNIKRYYVFWRRKEKEKFSSRQ